MAKKKQQANPTQEPSWADKNKEGFDPDLEYLKAVNYYNTTASDDDLKAWVLHYMKEKGFSKTDIKNASEYSDCKNFVFKYGTLAPGDLGFNTGIHCRILSNGGIISSQSQAKLDAILARITQPKLVCRVGAVDAPQLSIAERTSQKVSVFLSKFEECYDDLLQGRTPDFTKKLETPEPDQPKPSTVQPRFEEGATANLLDLFVEEKANEAETPVAKQKGAKKQVIKTTPPKLETQSKTLSFSEYMKQLNLKPIYMTRLHEWAVEMSKELSSKDREVIEAYSIYKKQHLSNTKLWLEEVITYCSKNKGSVTIRKKSRRRKRNPLDLVKKLLFCKESAEYSLKSVLPSSMIGASKIVLFNCKTRVLTVLEAANADGLTVKGSSIKEYDETKSKSRSVRKPDQMKKQIVSGDKIVGYRAFASYWNSLKTTEKPAKNRLNPDVIILGVY